MAYYSEHISRLLISGVAVTFGLLSVNFQSIAQPVDCIWPEDIAENSDTYDLAHISHYEDYDICPTARTRTSSDNDKVKANVDDDSISTKNLTTRNLNQRKTGDTDDAVSKSEEAEADWEDWRWEGKD